MVDGSATPLAPTEHEERFRALYETWYAAVNRWVLAMGGRRSDCDDLVQDVFVIVSRRLADFDGQNEAGWLYQITRHRVRDSRRAAWLRYSIFGLRAVAETPTPSAMDPGSVLETAQKRVLLERLLDTLNEQERAALVLFEVENYTGEEIAELHNVPVNTVWARIRRARMKLNRALLKLDKY